MEQSVKQFQLENILYFKRKRNKWIVSYDSLNTELKNFDELQIQAILFQYSNFIKINSYTIVNLEKLRDYILGGTDGFMVIESEIFNIPRRFIPQVREAHRRYLTQKYKGFKPTNTGISLKIINDSIQTDGSLDTSKIKFLHRNGNGTTVYFDDGHKKVYYKTLKEFEDIFYVEGKGNFIKVRRNLIINIKYISSFMIDNMGKVELKIDEQIIKISRRKLPEFKRKYIRNLQLFF
jgi:hypothetical protein